jgi:hypothetical protein
MRLREKVERGDRFDLVKIRAQDPQIARERRGFARKVGNMSGLDL